MTVTETPPAPANRPRPTPAYGPEVPPRQGLDALFGGFWPEGPRTAGRAQPLVPGLAVAIGAGAAVILPHRAPGSGLVLVLLAAAALTASPMWRRASPDQRAYAGVVLILLGLVLVRDAEWAVALSLLAAAGLAAATLCRASSVAGGLVAAFSVPLAALRGLPWLGRTLAAGRRVRITGPVLRTTIVSGLLVTLFVLLFASADALFASWVDGMVPDLANEEVVERLMVASVVTGVVLAAYYVAANPPKVERAALRPGRTVRWFEWMVPVVGVIGVFLVFGSAQLTALFGGHAYLEAQTGLSYAAYVHQGFGQLTAATAIVLLVVALTLRHAPREHPTDAYLVRLLLGLLCGLALVVVASALYRLHLYEEAYGFTRLRLLVAVFEGWVGLVLLLTMTAGVWLRARWLPKVAVVSGVLMIAGLTAANPDAMIAEHNIARYQATGRIDVAYLQRLSADAVPALDRLPEPLRTCVLSAQDRPDDDWLSWNLGRARAATILAERPAAGPRSCPAEL